MNKYQSRRGFALPLTIIIMLVLVVLGMSLLGLGVAESRFTVRQYDGTQAYYTARSGAEIALKKIEAELEDGYYDNVDDLFAAINAPVEGSVLGTASDTYVATYIDTGFLDTDKIKILSTATHNDNQKTTALVLQFRNPNALPLDWLNPGQIMKKGFFERTTSPVVVNVAKLLGHAPKKSATADTTWRAPSIHFIDYDNGYSLEISAKKLIFESDLISFRHKIKISTDDDSFILDNFEDGFADRFGGGDPVYLDADGTYEIPDGWGVVFLAEPMVEKKGGSEEERLAAGYYAFWPGIEFSNSDHVEYFAFPDETEEDPTELEPDLDTDKLIRIDNEETQDLVDQIIKENTTIGIDSKIWSAN